MEWFKLWWRQPDQYDRLIAHLRTRELVPFSRVTVAGIAGGLSIMAFATLWIPGGPQGGLARGCTLIASVGALFGAVLWALRTPTRAQAIRFAVVSIVSIALVGLAQHDPLIAALALTPLSLMASYIALFHPAWLMTLNLAIAVLAGGVEAVRLVERLNLVAAVVAYSLLLMLNLAAPFGVQIFAHVLGSDAVLSERDQLTGLLARHSFRRCARARLEQAAQQREFLVVVVIDLDRFKQLNDSYGHSTGDDALVAVSRALRDTNDVDAVIGRSGGEEFVIADIWCPDDVDRKARRLCAVIAELPFGVTASIGTAGIHPAYRTVDADDMLVELIAAADAAMYAAKRSGGHQVNHYEWPLPVPLSSVTEDAVIFENDGLTA